MARVQRLNGISEAIGSGVGLLIHQIAGRLRHLVSRTAEPAPVNIAVVCDAFLRYGSAQAIGLSKTGLSVTLYYIDRLDEFGNQAEDREILLESAREAGVELVPLPRRSIRALFTHALWLHRDLRRRKIAAAVVQSHIDPRYATLGLALPVALILHDPQTHSGDTLSTFPAPVRLISRIAELTSFCLIIHSSQLFEQLRPLLRRLPVGVVPHGTDMAREPAPVPSERNLILFGRLFAYKGIDTALEAFRALPKELSDVRLIVAGRGPLAALARSQQNVEVREEYIPDSDVDALLRNARLVLLPYKDATQSGVGLQAVAHGVPCVVSSAGALPDLIPDSLPTLIVPPDDPALLMEAIVEHIDHGDDLRRAIYDHAASNFAWVAAARRLRSELLCLGIDGVGVDDIACQDKIAVRS